MNSEIRNIKFWAGVILYNPDIKSVLLQRRDKNIPVNPDKWGFFGGANEPGEEPKDCVVREIKEELGVQIKKTDLMLLRDYLNEKRQTWHYIYSMNFYNDKSKMTLGEGAGFDWVPAAQAKKYDLTDTTRLDLEFFIHGL